MNRPLFHIEEFCSLDSKAIETSAKNCYEGVKKIPEELYLIPFGNDKMSYYYILIWYCESFGSVTGAIASLEKSKTDYCEVAIYHFSRTVEPPYISLGKDTFDDRAFRKLIRAAKEASEKYGIID